MHEIRAHKNNNNIMIQQILFVTIKEQVINSNTYDTAVVYYYFVNGFLTIFSFQKKRRTITKSDIVRFNCKCNRKKINLQLFQLKPK